jgi:hypothetical protein
MRVAADDTSDASDAVLFGRPRRAAGTTVAEEAIGDRINERRNDVVLLCFARSRLCHADRRNRRKYREDGALGAPSGFWALFWPPFD